MVKTNIISMEFSIEPGSHYIVWTPYGMKHTQQERFIFLKIKICLTFDRKGFSLVLIFQVRGYGRKKSSYSQEGRGRNSGNSFNPLVSYLLLNFKDFQGFSRFFKFFKGFSRFFKFFQGFSSFFKVFQGFSRFFKVFQGFSSFF